MKVQKRNGELEELDYEKINKVLAWATSKLDNVSLSDIAMNAKLQIENGTTTDMIHQVLIQSSVDLINYDTPNYQYVASNLINYLIRKRIFATYDNLPRLYDHTKNVIEKGYYIDEYLTLYSLKEFDVLNSYIKHDRDFTFTYAGIQQVIDKYLVRNRKTGELFETPQYMWMLISMYLFKDYNKTERIKKIKSFYDDISTFKLSLSTPILSGVRTPTKSFSSCVLIDCGDSIDSIFTTASAVGKYTANRAGIGLNMGRVRAIGDSIRNGEVLHTGVIPFLKVMEASVKSCQQNGIRGGSATVHFPIWHKEIEDIMVLKNNKGTEENRVRKLDYSIQINKLFYKRFQQKKDISLFSPNDVLDLQEAFYSGDNDKFEELYVKYENDNTVSKKTISSVDLFSSLAQERSSTGRLYIMNIDNVNTHSSFDNTQPEGVVTQSNLCLLGDTTVTIKINNTISEINLSILHELISFYKIDNIEVLSYNLETKQNEFKRISKSYLTAYVEEIYKIKDKVTNAVIKCTGDHKIYTENRGYVEAKDLEKTDILKYSKSLTTMDWVENLSIEKIKIDKSPVYDITVEDNHNFFANDILVHNCQEITLPTKSNDNLLSDEGEIAICVLCAINVGIIKNFGDLKQICENAVRSLDSIIDIQDYPIKSAEKMLKRRSIGIGITNFAYLLAKNKLKYGSPECLLFVDELMEHIQYYCLQASIELAKEKGKCEYFEYTKYSKGILPIDTYNKNVDKLVSRPYTLDWEQLRSDIKEFGLRNSTLTTIMPCESSGLVSNSTNSIEPVRQLLTNKKSKQGVIKQLVPEVNKLEKHYQLAFDIENTDINKTVAVLQKYIDQAISVNHYYNPKKFENGLIPVSSIVKDILEFYSYGGKNLYYANTSDGKTDNFDTLNNSVYNVKEIVKEETPVEEQYDMSGCDGGACSI